MPRGASGLATESRILGVELEAAITAQEKSHCFELDRDPCTSGEIYFESTGTQAL